MAKVLYRAYSLFNYYDHVKIEFEKWYIVSKTPCGKWLSRIEPNYVIKQTKDRFMYDNAHHPFAHPTKEEAIKALWHRKKRQIEIIERQKKLAEATMSVIDYELGRGENEQKDKWN